MADPAEKNVNMEEDEGLHDYEPESDALKHLRQELASRSHELKQSHVALEESQTRNAALEHAQSLSPNATAILELQEELAIAKRREENTDEREDDRREYIAELHMMIANLNLEARENKKAMEEKDTEIARLTAERKKLSTDRHKLTVRLAISESQLTRN